MHPSKTATTLDDLSKFDEIISTRRDTFVLLNFDFGSERGLKALEMMEDALRTLRDAKAMHADGPNTNSVGLAQIAVEYADRAVVLGKLCACERIESNAAVLGVATETGFAELHELLDVNFAEGRQCVELAHADLFAAVWQACDSGRVRSSRAANQLQECAP